VRARFLPPHFLGAHLELTDRIVSEGANTSSR
jgi:hypothetical protein